MSEIEQVEIRVSAERAKELAELSKITSLPEDGLHMLDVMDEAIAKGAVSKGDMLSGQDMLNSIAEKLEYQGDDPEIRRQMVNSIKLMSNYATTRLVPISIPENPFTGE